MGRRDTRRGVAPFDITQLPNGAYWVEVTANPQGALFDADPSNDTELRDVVLGGTPGARHRPSETGRGG